jgi:hypothetical protein
MTVGTMSPPSRLRDRPSCRRGPLDIESAADPVTPETGEPSDILHFAFETAKLLRVSRPNLVAGGLPRGLQIRAI